MCLFLFAGTHVSPALLAFHGGKFLVVTTVVISEHEFQETNDQYGRDIVVSIRIDMCGVN